MGHIKSGYLPHKQYLNRRYWPSENINQLQECPTPWVSHILFLTFLQ